MTGMPGLNRIARLAFNDTTLSLEINNINTRPIKYILSPVFERFLDAIKQRLLHTVRNLIEQYDYLKSLAFIFILQDPLEMVL